MGMKLTAKLSDRYYLSENERFLLLKFELIEPNEIIFEAGQYVSIKINDKGERRSYSIASTPDNKHGFSLLAEIVPEGQGSTYLKTLLPGDSVEVLGPMGRFIVDKSQEATTRNKLFVATGSGIVPIWSMINDLLINKKVTTPIRLHWGMKKEVDLFWMDNLERLSEAHPNFVYDVVLSRAGDEWDLCRGHVQDCLSRDFDLSSGPGLEGWEGYVCGAKEIVLDICAKLEELKMKNEVIYHEKFT